MDVQWRASAEDMACTEAEVHDHDWQPSVTPELVVQNAYGACVSRVV